ncbi:MAG: hypothetical protein COA42_05570 [Alteromonadaceae bacterium]|nr:MAG: hypothetical protein COA42_05570 [Alteromonadaceae bacterium]
MPDFLLYALLVGTAIAVVAGPLGSFAVWRKMAYFGDTLAHSALIGVALGLFLELNLTLSITFVCAVIACLLVIFERQKDLATDTLLGVFSHGSLALGLVCVSLYSERRVNLFAYLFGDFLTVTMQEALWICGVAFVLLLLIIRLWRPLLMVSMDEDLARVEGLPVLPLRLTLMMMIAVIVALAMKVVGVMLITALLIIPAAASRRLSSSPEAMAIIASCAGVLSVIGGVFASYWFDLPAGPAVVLSASLLFALTSLVNRRT